MTYSSLNKTVSGHWRIVWMELWDQEYIDLVENGYIKIENDGSGSFQFGVVSGLFNLDSTKTHFDNTWEGSQECDDAHGEIYGTLNAEGYAGDLCGTM